MNPVTATAKDGGNTGNAGAVFSEPFDSAQDKLRSVLVSKLHGWLSRSFANLRQMTGDDAYERYLVHHRQHHADQAVLDRRAYYLAEQQRKWTGVKRCC